MLIISAMALKAAKTTRFKNVCVSLIAEMNHCLTQVYCDVNYDCLDVSLP
jgi:hypothetical protein